MLDFHFDKLLPMKELEDDEFDELDRPPGPERPSDPAPIRELGVPRPESQKVLLVPAKARWRTGWIIWTGF